MENRFVMRRKNGKRIDNYRVHTWRKPLFTDHIVAFSSTDYRAIKSPRNENKGVVYLPSLMSNKKATFPLFSLSRIRDLSDSEQTLLP